MTLQKTRPKITRQMRQKTKMNKTFVYMAILILALVVVVGISGCGQVAQKDEAQTLGSDLSEIESLDQDLGNLETELNDSALTEIETLL
jgi:hypothetical protein